MTLDQIHGYIKEKNLFTKARNRDLIAKQQYLFGYMYWELKMNLSEIAREVNLKSHATIRAALIGLFDWQRHADFKEYTQDLYTIIPMKFPEYIDIKLNEEDIEYELTITLTRKEFHHFIDSNYTKESLIGMVFKQFIHSKAIRPTKAKSKRKYVRQVNIPNKRSDNR